MTLTEYNQVIDLLETAADLCVCGNYKWALFTAHRESRWSDSRGLWSRLLSFENSHGMSREYRYSSPESRIQSLLATVAALKLERDGVVK